MIDRVALLRDLKPVLTALEDDIRARVAAVDALSAHLAREHENAVTAQRTAMSLEEWAEGEITQAAVAWVLGCVFVRFLEDNLLIDQALLSGPGDRRTAALGHREEHFRRHPEQSDREYLEAAFRDVARHTAVAALYDERHNPLWRLGPTADGATALRELWTRIEPETGELVHDFTDPELDTRFLGDLYQDLSEAAKKRYALLQTPTFVEEFILDRTLDPAIAEFGLEQVRMIDPTCGSGHFLIGGFRRLFDLWQQHEPGTNVAVLVQRTLDAVYGVDINPYAVAVARFRLVVEALKTSGVGRLVESPAFRLNLATGDSLLHGAAPGQLFGGIAAHREGIRHAFETEDLPELERIFGQGYHAVVGNPPYIAVQDSALRDAYRDRYRRSCHGKYVLTVPFMERFFELAEVEAPNERGMLAGFVGKITGNNFMKREFGAPLVERFLPSVDLQTVIDASGAYIPGHGTPTVLLFGRTRPPVRSTLRVLDGIRGEPGQPPDPARGLVWSSIERLVDSPGEQDTFVRSSDIERGELLTHPMTLGVGRGLRRQLETGGAPLASVFESAGIVSFTLEDDAYVMPEPMVHRHSIEQIRPIVEGEGVRDWRTEIPSCAVFPYDLALEPVPADRGSAWWRHLWRSKTNLASNVMFAGRTKIESGLAWYEFGRLTSSKLRAPLTITWGEVATHNHFVLDRGGKVFKQTAPVIKLPEGATQQEHLTLLGVLNSSVACFWLKQVCQTKGASGMGRGIYDEAWESFYAFNSTNVADLPLPAQHAEPLSAALDTRASQRASLLDGLAALDHPTTTLRDYLAAQRARDEQLTIQMISLQEELDWQVLAAYGLVADDLPVPGLEAPPVELGQRAFEIVLARQVAEGEAETTWFERHGSTPITDLPADWPAAYRDVVEQRIALIEADPDVRLIERPEHKRRWVRKPWEDRQREALTRVVLDALEAPEIWTDLRLRSTAELTDVLRRDPRLAEAVELLAIGRDEEPGATVERLVLAAGVPQAAAQRLTEKGLAKRTVWERVWELQRAEDRIDARTELPEDDPSHLTAAQAHRMQEEEVGRIPIPPRYGKPDFLSDTAWKHRGKLDVPKERFVLLPTAQRGADPSPVVAWAGWDELDLARAIASRLVDLREQDAADSERLAPLLAGVSELVPWINQWHPEVDSAYGGTPGDFFELWLDTQLVELSLTRDVLRAWRPAARARGRRKAAT